MGNRSSDIEIQGSLSLTSGQEWYSDPFNVDTGSIVRIKSLGTQKFYVGLYSEQGFQQLHSGNPQAFPFTFGSDRQDIDEAFVIRIDGAHRIVVRLGVFTPNGSTDLLVEIIGPLYEGF